MIIRTITCHNVNNFGASLQARALYEYLSGLGHDVRIIDYIPIRNGCASQQTRTPLRRIMESVPLRPILKAIEYHRARRWRERYRKFEEFTAQLPMTKRYSSLAELRNDPPKAELYLAGSDQIWNPGMPAGNDPAYYLDFGDSSVKRASYAASFGSGHLPEKTAKLADSLLNRFDNISVRESSALAILSLMGYEGTLVADPVFLLSDYFWHNMANGGLSVTDNYILVYAFDASPMLRRTAVRISRSTGLKILSITPHPLGRGFKDCSNSGPLDFLSLLRGASLIITESYHALAFSVIFRKPFYAFLRHEDLNSRIIDFLSLLGLSDRIVHDDSINHISDIDYSDIDDILMSLRNNSYKYIQRITTAI